MTGEGKAYLGTILIAVILILLGVGFISEGPKHVPVFAAYAAGLILLAMLPIISLVAKRSVRSRTRTIRKP